MPTPRLLQRFFPFLSWPRPRAVELQGELFAGLTIGLMVIPQGVAYAALAGMPLITGIYASLLPALIAVLWGSSSRLSVGPTALTCLLVASSLTGMAAPGSAEWINLAMWLAMLSGLLQIALGWMRFGWLVNVVSSPVLMAFTQAAAILILLSQVPDLLGYPSLRVLWASPQSMNIVGALFGIATLALLIVAKRFVPRVPAVVVIVVLASVASSLLDYEGRGGHVVGALQSGLPALMLPSALPWETLSSLIVPVLVITLVSFLETAASAKIDNQNAGKSWNENQDLIGQGMAKVASAVCGSFPPSSSFSRSALNLYAGARTGWATIFSVVVVLL
ncbi:MAG: SulP family inorganic anion transporter, partial [Alcaligenaceae bacterium]